MGVTRLADCPRCGRVFCRVWATSAAEGRWRFLCAPCWAGHRLFRALSRGFMGGPDDPDGDLDLDGPSVADVLAGEGVRPAAAYAELFGLYEPSLAGTPATPDEYSWHPIPANPGATVEAFRESLDNGPECG